MVNLDSPLKLLNAAIDAGVDRWVQLSSVGAYGPAYKGIIDENRSDNPIGRYEKTKSEFDVMLLEASKLSQIKVSIIRPSNVYGIGMTNDSIFKLFNSIRNGYFAFIGPVGASANYIHVKDVVQALGLCLEHPNAVNQIFIVSAWATIEKMVSGLIQETGIKFPSRRLSFALADWLSDKLKWIPNWPLTSSRVRALSMRCSYSTGKIEKELGWKLTMPVEEGMIQLNKHFK